MIRIIKNEKNDSKADISFTSKNNFWEIKSAIKSCTTALYNQQTRNWLVDIIDLDEVEDKLLELKDEIIQIDINLYKILNIYRERRSGILELRNQLEGID